MAIFVGGFLVLCVLCVIFYSRTTIPGSADPQYNSLKKTYLFVYLLAAASDWLQGPYMYALYDSYGLSTHDIEQLFVAGYGSSMVFGTVVGSIADKYGRRTNCILYAFLYSFSCFSKHFNNFHFLFAGRLASGVATSILCSNFESWVVCEHHKRGFDVKLLSGIFSQAVFGNSLVAIACGLISQVLADRFGFTAPFDMAIIVMAIMVTATVFLWTENYGDSSAKTLHSFQAATVAIREDSKIICLGLIQSLFEGSMYTFVLEWTPALMPADHLPVVESSDHSQLHSRGLKMEEAEESSHRAAIPHGFIFAAFMVAIMVGSSIFKILSRSHEAESFMRFVLLVASASLVVPILFHGNQLAVYVSFIVFEICVGIFWPSLSFMRSKYIPESSRATVMNLFRVPLNFIVIVILTQVCSCFARAMICLTIVNVKQLNSASSKTFWEFISNFSMSVIFQCCVIFLLIASAFQHRLYRLSSVPSVAVE